MDLAALGSVGGKLGLVTECIVVDIAVVQSAW